MFKGSSSRPSLQQQGVPKEVVSQSHLQDALCAYMCVFAGLMAQGVLDPVSQVQLQVGTMTVRDLGFE